MSEAFESWAIVEIMGHQTYAGLVSEQVVGGTAFVRVDIPETEGQPAFTKLFGGASIYCITPTTEPIARAMAKRYSRPPLNLYDLPEEWQEKIRQPALPQHKFPTDEERDEFDQIEDEDAWHP